MPVCAEPLSTALTGRQFLCTRGSVVRDGREDGPSIVVRELRGMLNLAVGLRCLFLHVHHDLAASVKEPTAECKRIL